MIVYNDIKNFNIDTIIPAMTTRTVINAQIVKIIHNSTPRNPPTSVNNAVPEIINNTTIIDIHPMITYILIININFGLMIPLIFIKE